MKYLDEQIEVTVSNITVTESKTYIYKVYKGSKLIFTGNVFLEAGVTSKIFNITDILTSYIYVNTGTDDRIIDSCIVVLAINNTAHNSNTETVYFAYRYPHLLKRLEYDGQYNIQPGLLPVYPNNQSENYNVNLMATYSSTVVQNTGKYLVYNNGTKTGMQFLYNVPAVLPGGTTTKNTNVKLSDMANYASYGTYTPINNGVDLDDAAVNTELRGDDGFLHWQDGDSFDVVYRTIDVPTPHTRLLGTFNIFDEGSKRIEFETGSNRPIDVCFVCNGALTVHILTNTPMKPITKYVLTFNVVINDKVNDDYGVAEIILSEFVPSDIEKGIYEETVSQFGTSTFKKIGDFCDNLDGYYLQWQDRLGGIQSQHFDKVDIFSNNYNRTTITNYKGYKRPVYEEVTSKWVINSNWINEMYYPNYESIFVSPFLKLYDVKEDKVYDVVITDSNFTEKTFHNQGRQLFNLQLNLEKANKQNIIY